MTHFFLRIAPLGLALLAACEPTAEPREVPPFALGIEATHQFETWSSKPYISAEFSAVHGLDSVERFSGSMTFDPAMNRVAMTFGGVQLVFDQGKVTASDSLPGGRFHVLTWPYFLDAPYKLADPGSSIEAMEDGELWGRPMKRARLTFSDSVGDTPDDWYVLYKTPEGDTLKAMAYIVTFKKDVATAEQEPHMVHYEDFQLIDRVPVPHRWTYWNWSDSTGAFGDPLFTVRLSNVSFPETADFTPPAAGIELTH